MNIKNKKVSEERAFSVIRAPLLTEKSTNLNQYNQYSFLVSKDSNVYEIKDAIEKIFKVKVMKINTSIQRGKMKSFKGAKRFYQRLKLSHNLNNLITQLKINFII